MKIDCRCPVCGVPRYCRRLEKYDARGFQIGVPGFNAALLSPDLLSSRYLYLQNYDMLFQVGPKDWLAKNLPMTISKFNGKSFDRIEEDIKASATQPGVCIKGFRRAVAMKHARMEMVDSDVWVAQPSKGRQTAPCVPLRGEDGKFTIMWLDTEEAGEATVEGYSSSPMECVHRLLDAHCDYFMSKSDSPEELEWWNGGAMQKLSKEPLRQSLQSALKNVVGHLQTKTDLLFVYDIIGCKTPFQMKFGLDAGRPPLCDFDDEEFEETYGLARRLLFKSAVPRPCEKSDWWSSVYV